MRLPSEQYLPGSPKPLGFIDDPSDSDIQRSSSFIRDLVTFGRTLSQPTGSELRIRFCHIRYTPGLPFNLFGFHVWSVDDSGGLLDPFEGKDLQYALVINQPAELQAEIALAFLMQLGYRQRFLNRGVNLQETDFTQATEHLDHEALVDLTEKLRRGRREALRAAIGVLNEAGLRVSLEYQPDVHPKKVDLDRRLFWLRRVYNEIEAVRGAIDRTVSLLGGREGVMRASGGIESVREFLQQRFALLDLRHYMNHAMRDGEVCGNGYLFMPDTEPFAPYCVPPESVEIDSSGTFQIETDDRVICTRQVTHIKGIEQIDSAYGISILEPFVFAVNQADVLGSVRSESLKWLSTPGLPLEARQHLEANLETVDDILRGAASRIDEMLWFFQSDRVPAPLEGLYLPGYESYAR